MKLKYLALSALSLYGAFVMVACGNKSSTTNDPLPVYACPTGTSYQNAGNCYNQYGQIIGTYGAGISNVDAGYLAETQRNNNLSITDSSVFNSFLEKAHSVCNRSSGINGGLASCDSWVSGYFAMAIQSKATQASSIKITFFTQPNVNPYGYYSIQLPSAGDLLAGILGFPVFSSSGTARQLIQLDAVVSNINAYKGFEARAYGPIDTAANRSLIQLQVANNKLLDSSMDFKLIFEGKQMASGSLFRCINPNCQ